MGWGDRFISHHFETIYWFAVISALKKTYPILLQSFSQSVICELSLLLELKRIRSEI